MPRVEPGYELSPRTAPCTFACDWTKNKLLVELQLGVLKGGLAPAFAGLDSPPLSVILARLVADTPYLHIASQKNAYDACIEAGQLLR